MKFILSFCILLCCTSSVRATYIRNDLPEGALERTSVRVRFQKILHFQEADGTDRIQSLDPLVVKVIQLRADGSLLFPSHFPTALKNYINDELEAYDRKDGTVISIEEPKHEACCLPLEVSNSPGYFYEYRLFTNPSVIASRLISKRIGMSR